VVGILVDDAIVEIENIMRHLRMGKTPYQAAMEAADEIGLAVIATTFTLIAVFLPTAFMSGVAGKFFVQFGWTAAIAVFFSLVVARMLTPMMAAYILKPPTHEEKEPRWITSTSAGRAGACAPLSPAGRRGVLRRLLRAGAAAAHRLHPARRLSQTQVYLTLPPGSTLKETWPRPSRRASGAEEPAREAGLHRHRRRRAGSDPFAPAGRGAQGVLTINLTHRNERRGLTKQAIEAQLREALVVLPGVRVKVGLGAPTRNTCWCWRDGRALAEHAARSSASCAPSPASARDLHRQPGAARAGRAARFRAPPTWA
jgi:multidrug efflux pump subunit AcrB